MSVINCPRCQQGVANDPRLAGQAVGCPHCGASFRMPAAVSVVALPPMPVAVQGTGPPAIHVEDQQRPVNILVNTGDARPRLKPRGWFANSFLSAGGVLLAVLIFLAVLVAVPIVWWQTKISRPAEQRRVEWQAKTEKVRRISLVHLQPHGIQQLSEGTVLQEWAGDHFLTGEGRDRDGRLHDVIIKYKVGRFGQKEQWEVRGIVIDGESVYTPEP